MKKVARLGSVRVDLPRKLRALTFPLTAPTWPGTVPKPQARGNMGVDYDTTWAREPWARAVRALLTEAGTRGVVAAVAPSIVMNRDRLSRLGGPLIFAANHSSHLDTAIVLSALPFRFRQHAVVAAGADYFFDRQWKAAWWSLAMNVIPVERTKVTRKSAHLAAQLLRDGWNLVIFPEGGRTPDGWMQDFRGGAAYLSSKAGVPVVPVFIQGSRRILGKGARRLRPGRTHVLFGNPMIAHEGEDVRKFNQRIEDAVTALADEWDSDWWTARRQAARRASPSVHGPTAAAWRRSWAATPSELAPARRRWPRK